MFDANFLFINPSITTVEKGRIYSSRLRYLLSRICKYRRQKYLDGILIVPNSSVYLKGNLPPTSELLAEINANAFIFEKFDSFFRVRIPLFIFAHNGQIVDQRIFKNIFKHDEINENDDLYLGFNCNVTQRKPKERIYDFYQRSIKDFVIAFDTKTAQIMYKSFNYTSALDTVHAVYRVKAEIFSIADNYLSHLFDVFEKNSSSEISSVSILNSILFSSYEGSNTEEAIKNLFAYLATHQKDKVVFSQRFIRSRSRANVLLGLWTGLFTITGVLFFVLLYFDTASKKQKYIKKSMANYDSFAKLFNEKLSNRYPFASVDIIKSADLDSLYIVFEEYEKITSGNLGYFYTHIDKLTKRKDIQKFVQGFQNSFALLKPRVDANGAFEGPFNLAVKFKFRTPQTDEVLANRIVNWYISTGRFAYGSAYGDYWQAIFPWSYGDSFVFTVELPKKSDANYQTPLTPLVPDNKDPHVEQTNDSVKFSYQRDVWSLFRFVDNYTICTEEKTACQKGILTFTIPLRNNSSIIFYSTLELYDKDGNLLSIPNFPHKAPYFKS